MYQLVIDLLKNLGFQSSFINYKYYYKIKRFQTKKVRRRVPLSSTKMGHFFSAPEIPQFNTKNSPIQHPPQFNTLSGQHQKHRQYVEGFLVLNWGGCGSEKELRGTFRWLFSKLPKKFIWFQNVNFFAVEKSFIYYRTFQRVVGYCWSKSVIVVSRLEPRSEP